MLVAVVIEKSVCRQHVPQATQATCQRDPAWEIVLALFLPPQARQLPSSAHTNMTPSS